MKKRVIAVVMTVLMAVSLAACGAPSDSENNGTQGGGQESSFKVFNYGIESAPGGTFLYQYHQDQYNGYITYAVSEGLTKNDEEGNDEPCLAKSWDISEDGRTYTFHLQEGVKWHDGEPFSAEDVAFTYNWMANPDYNGFYSAFIANIEGYEAVHDGTAETLSGVQVIDDNTIAVTTTEVYTSMLGRIGVIMIMPKHIWEDVDVATADKQTELLREGIIGTGPFKMKEFKADQYITLEKNPDYWQGEPKLDELNFIVVNSETVQAQLMDGSIDYFGLLNIKQDDIDLYEDAGINVVTKVANSYQCMQINEQNPLLAPVEIRQALAYAINRQGMVDSLLDGYGNVANTIYCSGYWANPGDENLSVFEYDPEKAVEMFESQGWTFEGTIGGADAAMYDPDGNAASFRLFCPTGNKAREQSAVIIQDNLKAIGITVDVQTMEFATLLSILDKFEEADRYDFALTGYGMGADPDTSMLTATGGAVNYGAYSDEEADALLKEALTNPDREASHQAYKDLAVRISETLPVLYLYNMHQGYVYTDKVTSFVDNTYWTCYNCHLWDVK